MSESLRELEWANERVACAVFLRGFEADRHLGDPYFYPLYEAAESMNLAVCAHAGNSSFWIEDFYSRAGGLPVFKFPVVDGFLSLLHGKVPEQFPNLRFGFIETASQDGPVRTVTGQ
jgi:predicted TIM-barrel fold metal-dependent hydrolase